MFVWCVYISEVLWPNCISCTPAISLLPFDGGGKVWKLHSIDLKKVESLVASTNFDASAPTMGIESLAEIRTKALQILIAKAFSPPARYRHQKMFHFFKTKI